MQELDYGVGKILEKVKELGLAENTLAIFSSDNGAATYAKEQGITFIQVHKGHGALFFFVYS